MTALTNITAPSRKLILTTIGLVVGAHLLTGGALSNMAPTALPKQILPEPKPIEVKMITLAPVEEKEPEPEVIKQKQAEPEVRRASAPKVVKKPPTSTKQAPKPKPKTQTQQQSTAKKYQPPTKVKKTQQATATTAPTTQPTTTINNTQTITAKNNNSSHTTPAPATDKGTIAAISAAELQAQQIERERKEREAEEERKRQAAMKAEQDRLAAEAAAQAKREREAAAAKKAAEEAAANQGPVNFSASEASWRVPPNMNGISDEPVTLTVTLKVDKQGNITSVSVTGGDRKASGLAKRRIQRAKLNPFMRNGAPVAGTVTLTVQAI